MYIDIVIKELDDLDKNKERITSNNYINKCDELKKKYDLYKKIDDNNNYIINLINNNFIDNNKNKNNNNNNKDYDIKKKKK